MIYLLTKYSFCYKSHIMQQTRLVVLLIGLLHTGGIFPFHWARRPAPSTVVSFEYLEISASKTGVLLKFGQPNFDLGGRSLLREIAWVPRETVYTKVQTL